MSKYKKIMLNKGIMQKELLDGVSKVDRRVDKSLLSKFVNDVCLPNPNVLDCLCKILNCDVLDIYDPREIDLLKDKPNNTQNKGIKAVATARKDRGGKSHGDNVYNLTVEINRDIANRVFDKKSLRKLGFANKSDCIRTFIFALDKKLKRILEKEKAVKGDDTHQDG